jgi:hypothetical protein
MMGLSLKETGPLSTGLGKLWLYSQSNLALQLDRMQETILAWADGYDAEHRREVERIVRGPLRGDDGFFNVEDLAEHARVLPELVEAIYHGAYAAGQRSVVIKRAKEARLRKQANDYVERFSVAYAVKRVTDRLGNRKKRDYKPGDKLPLSDTYAAGIRGDVLKFLGRSKDAKKPSVRAIRRAIKRTNDGVAFKD